MSEIFCSADALVKRWLPDHRLCFVLLLVLVVRPGLSLAGGPVDTLILGSTESEQAHALTAEQSKTYRGGLGETARQLLAPAKEGFEGGRLGFTMKVDPDRPNYLTARLWGSDRSDGELILFCEGKQVGYRHVGDIDVLDISNGAPACQGRFLYETTPLPEAMTHGRTELHFEVRSLGPIWPYGKTFAQYQKPMTEPTRGIYKVYTHTDGFFVLPADEKQGAAPVDPPTRAEPGPEILATLRARVSKEIDALLLRPTLDQHQLWFLARAYHVKWTPAYQNPEIVKKAVATLDATFNDFRRDPATVQVGKAIYNGDWFGIGPAAAAIVLLADPLKPSLDMDIAGSAGTTRRAGWAEMFVACRDWHREHRRQYSNQTMISDTYGVYFPNRAAAILDDRKALAEPEALRYLYESAGLQPWLGSEKNGQPSKTLGEDYLQLTDEGLTKELGFVGYYGEVLDWMTAMYDATRPALGQPGDEKLRAVLVKAARARAPFRYPALDDDGNRAMRAETLIGWRDADHYPGDVTYTQRSTWDASALDAAAATLDPELLGGAQQMLADNQFFVSLRHQMQTANLRATAGMLDAPEAYELVRAQAAGPQRLPMTADHPDSVFADEEDGVVAIKHGSDILYASLYWRARFGINFLARVHLIQPASERIAVVRQDTQFTPSGLNYTREDWINMGTARGGLRYPGNLHSAHQGETLPIAKIPGGVAFTPGDENLYAGRGDFYTLRYGPYLIGMNMSRDRTFDLRIPKTPSAVHALTSGSAEAAAGSVIKVEPRSTVVFYLDGYAEGSGTAGESGKK